MKKECRGRREAQVRKIEIDPQRRGYDCGNHGERENNWNKCAAGLTGTQRWISTRTAPSSPTKKFLQPCSKSVGIEFLSGWIVMDRAGKRVAPVRLAGRSAQFFVPVAPLLRLKPAPAPRTLRCGRFLILLSVLILRLQTDIRSRGQDDLDALQFECFHGNRPAQFVGLNQ